MISTYNIYHSVLLSQIERQIAYLLLNRYMDHPTDDLHLRLRFGILH